MKNSNNTLVSTVFGTFLSVSPQLFNWSTFFMDILQTALLAAFGAIVSFIISQLMRHFMEKRSK